MTIAKTYKLFINGAFPRTESGRYQTLQNSKNETIATCSVSSKKDVRNAVVAAQKALPGWSKRSAYNRSQILYRIAEILEQRKEEFVAEMQLMGIRKPMAQKEVQMSIDRTVYYAGWCDKYQQLISTVNPVASAHFNFSLPEPVGVVALIAPTESPLLGLLSILLPTIAGGNTCVGLASESYPLSAITLAEVLATSDVPAGVVNLLTGFEADLYATMASHMDIQSLVYTRHSSEVWHEIHRSSIANLKRIHQWHYDWYSDKAQHLHFIGDLQEIKTTWHPIETLTSSGGAY